MNNKNKIGIIGGGPSGIASAKAAIECGFDVVIFEKQDDIGGVWSIKNGKAWDNMKTHISYVSMSFSDYFWDVPEERKPFHPSREEMYTYFYNYCKHFNILDKFKLKTNVIDVNQINDTKKWLVKYYTTNNDSDVEFNEEIFDFVIISTGFFAKKKEINIKNKFKNFNGKIWTSDQYKNQNQFKDKRVLIIGGFSSGIEIACDISNVTKNLYIICNKKNWIVKRMFPNNELNLPVVDHCIQYREFQYKEMPDIEFNIIKNKILNITSQNQRENEYFKMTIPDYKTSSVIISDNFLDILKSGEIKLINKTINYCENNNIIFGDENETTTIEFDDIICCDGYDIDLSFFNDKIKEKISHDFSYPHMPIVLHKHVFSPDLENIGFIGLFKGASMIEYELQARWVVYCWANISKLPTREQMLHGISKEFEIRNQKDPSDIPQFILKSSIRYCDEIAKEIGCLPDFEKLKQSDPYLYDILWNKMYHPAAYRLVGPFSNINAEYNIKNDFNHYYKKK
ncbi:hypothetical protein ACTFIR_012177 [Dictyostelium discoideum]